MLSKASAKFRCGAGESDFSKNLSMGLLVVVTLCTYASAHQKKCQTFIVPSWKQNETEQKKCHTEIKGCLWLTRGLLGMLESTSNSLLLLVCQNMGHIVQNLSHKATLWGLVCRFTLDTFYDKNIWQEAWTFLGIPSFQGTYVTVGAYMRLVPTWRELLFTHFSIEFPVLRHWLNSVPS